MLVPIEGISLSICVLLKYVYTKDLDLNIDPTQHLMCDMDHLQDKGFGFLACNEKPSNDHVPQDEKPSNDHVPSVAILAFILTRSSCSMNRITTNHLIDLAINCTRLKTNIGNSVSINTTLDINTGYSTVCTITRQSSHEVCIGLQSNSDTASFKFMHCLTCKADVKVVGVKQWVSGHQLYNGYDLNGNFIRNSSTTQIVVLEESIADTIDRNKYAFHLVLSPSEKLPFADQEIKPSVASVNIKSFKEMFPEKYQDTLKFLKDPKSVNTGFLFTIHSCQRKIALWAHSTLLDKYPRFQELFEKMNSRLLLIPIEGISLTTFCVMLKYLYTEDLDLSVDPTQYLMCDMDH
ncbi:hypothetical protein BGZ65_002332, partial [Modicella reniformis]